MERRPGIVSLAVDFPSVLRTNDFWRRRHPEAVATAEARALARMWAPEAGETRPEARAFDEEMAPYLGDPFRGAVERRALAPGETVLSVELGAAREALHAAGLQAGEVDLLISSTFVSDHPGLGHAAFLAKELGTGGTAWNLETACTSALEAARTAAALVRAGEAKRVLMVASCMYSKASDPTDSISWTVGDGAAAVVVADDDRAAPVLGAFARHTGDTCGAMYFEVERAAADRHLTMRASADAGRRLRETSATFLLDCCDGALKAAGVRREEIAFFVCNTPLAWFARFAARSLGIDRSRTIDTFPRYGNLGPALWPVNLFTAARAGRLSRGDLVLAYAVGSVSSAGAMVLRWNDVALGPEPAPPRVVE